MSWDQIVTNWEKLALQVRGTWTKLTYEDCQRVAGKRDHLIAAIQNRYGISKDAAEQELDAFERNLEPIKH